MQKYGKAVRATNDNTIRHIGIACWITKATNTPSEYVTIIAFPLQQWLYERASMLLSTHFYIPALFKVK